MSLLRSATVAVLITFLARSGATIVQAQQKAMAATQSTSAQKAMSNDVPEACPVTKPSARPFVPPAPYRAKESPDSFWFGTDSLWTRLPANGTWRGLPHYTPGDPTFRQRLFFWRQGYNPRTEPRPKLTVTGKRLDAPAPPLLSDPANNGLTSADQGFMVTGINIPTLGCWEITGKYEDYELTFVVWVAE